MTATPNGSRTTGNPKRQVLIVDDHPIVRHGLGQLIEQADDLEVCGHCPTASDALESIRESGPDAAVVDITLDGSNGLELIKQLKAQGETMKVLVASMHDEQLYAERALRAGASGYVNKAEGTERIVEALHQILDGRVYLSGNMTERMLSRMMRGEAGQGEDQAINPIETLSDRELEVFEMVGQGQTTRQIAGKLHLSPKTVETHREHIKTKLNLDNNNELVRQAVQWALERQ